MLGLDDVDLEDDKAAIDERVQAAVLAALAGVFDDVEVAPTTAYEAGSRRRLGTNHGSALSSASVASFWDQSPQKRVTRRALTGGMTDSGTFVFDASATLEEPGTAAEIEAKIVAGTKDALTT